MKKIVLYITAILLSQLVYAWPGGSTGGPGMNKNDGTNTGNRDIVPVDGGIVTVTALAIGYGVRQARKRKEEKNNDNGAV
jgi:hypothetical protein